VSRPGRGLRCVLAGVLAGVTCWPQLTLAQDDPDAPAPLPVPASAPLPVPATARASAPAESETVIARRLNDSVAVRFAADGSERVLYFFAPRAELSVGDEVEQGPSGQTSVVLADGGKIEMYASGHLVIHGLGSSRGGEIVDELSFPLLTTAELTSGGRKIVCELPGGSEVEFIDGRITVRVVPGRLTIRNEGGNPVMVRGLMTQEPGSTEDSGRGELTLARGDEVGMPYFRHRNRQLGPADGSWAGLSLREIGSLEVEHDAQRLVVTSHAAENRKAAFTVGGVRTRVPAGSGMVFERVRRGAPSLLQGVGQPTGSEASGEAGGEDAPGAVTSPSETVPLGMTAIGFDEYVLAQQKGHSVEDLAALGYWVSPAVLAEFERLSAEATSPEEGQMTDDPASGEDTPSADEAADDLPEEGATAPEPDEGAAPAAGEAAPAVDGAAPAADEGSETDDEAPEGEPSDDTEDNR